MVLVDGVLDRRRNAAPGHQERCRNGPACRKAIWGMISSLTDSRRAFAKCSFYQQAPIPSSRKTPPNAPCWLRAWHPEVAWVGISWFSDCNFISWNLRKPNIAAATWRPVRTRTVEGPPAHENAGYHIYPFNVAWTANCSLKKYATGSKPLLLPDLHSRKGHAVLANTGREHRRLWIERILNT
jgi:hypothetical protein